MYGSSSLPSGPQAYFVPPRVPDANELFEKAQRDALRQMSQLDSPPIMPRVVPSPGTVLSSARDFMTVPSHHSHGGVAGVDKSYKHMSPPLQPAAAPPHQPYVPHLVDATLSTVASDTSTVAQSFETVVAKIKAKYEEQLRVGAEKHESLKQHYTTNLSIIEARDAEIQELERQCDQLTNLLERREAEVRRHRQLMDECERRCAQSTRDLKDQFDQQIAQMRSTSMSVETECHSLRKALSKAQSRLGGRSRLVSETEDKLTASQRQLEQTLETLSRCRAEKRLLEESAEKWDTQLKAERALKADMVRRHEHEMRSALDRAEEIERKSNKVMCELTGKCDALQRRVEEADAAMMRLRNGLYKELHCCRRSAKEQQESASERICELEKECAAKVAQFNEMRAEVEAKDGEYAGKFEELGDRIDSLMQERLTTLEELESVRERLRKATSEVEAYKRENGRFDKERNQWSETIIARTKECATMRADLESMSANNRQLRKKAEELKATKKALRELRESMEAIRSEYDTMNRRVVEQDSIVPKLKGQLISTREEMDRVTREREALLETNHALQRALFNAQRRSEQDRAEYEKAKRKRERREAEEQQASGEVDSQDGKGVADGAGGDTHATGEAEKMSTMSSRRKVPRKSRRTVEGSTASSSSRRRHGSGHGSDRRSGRRGHRREVEASRSRDTVQRKSAKSPKSPSLPDVPERRYRTRGDQPSVSSPRARLASPSHRESTPMSKRVGELRRKNQAMWKDLQEMSAIDSQYSGLETQTVLPEQREDREMSAYRGASARQRKISREK